MKMKKSINESLTNFNHIDSFENLKQFFFTFKQFIE